MNPGAFLDLLWGHKPEDLFLLLWTLPEKRSHWFRELDRAADFAVNGNGSEVYVGVGLARKDHGVTHRCVSEEIAGIAGVWADLDLKSDAHQKPLPTRIEDALTILPPSMPPSVVVATGNGAHAWWLFKEPWTFDDDHERQEAANLVSRWHTLLRYASQQNGWVFDRLSDLARVLRIPGTVNRKDPAHPKAVDVYSLENRRYRSEERRVGKECRSRWSPYH